MKEFVPLLQTVAWIALITLVLVWGRKQWGALLNAVSERIQRGDQLKLGIGNALTAELGRSAKGSPHINPDTSAPDPDNADNDELEQERMQLGEGQRGVNLVHVAAPAASRPNWYDLHVYLAAGYNRSKFGDPEDLGDVRTAEFQIGPKFSPSKVEVTNSGQRHIGFTTSAYAPFLCICRVTFEDGTRVDISRFIDFESAQLAENVDMPPPSGMG